MSWSNYTYKKPEYAERKPGIYRCIVLNAETGTSKSSGKKMITITLRPSGTATTVRAYIVDNEYFDDNMSRFLDAFPALKNNPSPDNCFAWRGAMGAAQLRVNDKGYFEHAYWVPPERTDKLPEFVWRTREGEPPEMPVLQEFTELGDDDEVGDDIPF